MSFPSSPINGQTTVTNNITYVYNSSGIGYWTRVLSTGTTSGGGTNNNTSTTSLLPPTTATVGDIWYQLGTDVVYRYEFDGTSRYWIDFNGPTGTGGGGSGTTFTGGTVANLTIFQNTVTITTGSSIIIGSAVISTGTSASSIAVSGALVTGNRGISSSSMPAGAILQVTSTFYTSIFSTSAAAWTAITGYNCTITPTSSTSKILVMVAGVGGISGADSAIVALQRNGLFISSATNTTGYFSGSANSLYNGSTDANNNKGFTITYLDSPSTTATVTYQVFINSLQSVIVYINALGSNASGQVYSSLAASNIVLMEVAQ